MPELPEVETLRIQFAQLLPGLTIKNVQVFKQKSFVGEKKYLIGKKIIGIRRFAKMLVIDLSNGLSLAVHLKMSGQLIYKGVKNKHTRVIITFTNGDRLFFHDIRRFGWIKIVENDKVDVIPASEPESQWIPGQARDDKKAGKLSNLIKHLGPEPLRDLTIEKFQKILKTSRRPIKLVLMDQQKIAGVGNIYTNDSLFLARIHPKTPANKLFDHQMVKLFDSLIKVLKQGVKWGGASKTNFLDAYGKKGQVQEHFYVYGRDGEKCISECGELINRITLGGRGTFYCPNCQVI